MLMNYFFLYISIMKHYKRHQLDQLIKSRKETRRLVNKERFNKQESLQQNDVKNSNINFLFNNLFEDYNQTLINTIERNEK